VKSLALRYGADGKAEARWTLVQTANDCPLYLPCCANGATAERLAGELEDGQHRPKPNTHDTNRQVIILRVG
jgi:hypothetical protein